MQYTIRNIPDALDREIREHARREGTSLNETIVQHLMLAFGLGAQAVARRDLAGVVGTWVEDPEIDEVLRDQRVVDPRDWE